MQPRYFVTLCTGSIHKYTIILRKTQYPKSANIRWVLVVILDRVFPCTIGVYRLNVADGEISYTVYQIIPQSHVAQDFCKVPPLNDVLFSS